MSLSPLLLYNQYMTAGEEGSYLTRHPPGRDFCQISMSRYGV
uniref:Uncharacterized protein n=1 Tax=Anguilla anguilla TaxID=7936 RepID=A0A0E9XIV3_ANGAN